MEHSSLPFTSRYARCKFVGHRDSNQHVTLHSRFAPPKTDAEIICAREAGRTLRQRTIPNTVLEYVRIERA